jgi:hypothetical protein
MISGAGQMELQELIERYDLIRGCKSAKSCDRYDFLELWLTIPRSLRPYRQLGPKRLVRLEPSVAAPLSSSPSPSLPQLLSRSSSRALSVSLFVFFPRAASIFSMAFLSSALLTAKPRSPDQPARYCGAVTVEPHELRLSVIESTRIGQAINSSTMRPRWSFVWMYK